MNYSISEDHMLPCMFKTATGMDCPGCGTQRAFSKMADGKVVDSYVMFPALIPTLIVFLFIPIQIKLAAKISSDWIISFFLIAAFVTIGAYFLRSLPV